MAYNSTNDIKLKIIGALGAAWIRDIIMQDPTSALTNRGLEEGMDNGLTLGMGRANSAGEQVDLLNPMEEDGDNGNGDEEGQDEREDDDDDDYRNVLPSSRMSLDMFLPDAGRQRKLTLNGDLDQTTEARQDDIAVQEQTFDLIRNVVCDPGAPEMIDFLFKEIGQDEILDALADKLRPRSIQHLHHRRGPSSNSNNRSLNVPTEIIVAVSFVIINIAAGLPQHRQKLLGHPDLIRNLLGYFNHPHRQVRVNCVWIVINLTDEDEQSDREESRERALELRSLGVADKLRALRDDPDLDVRERVKTALHQVNSLM